MIIINPDNINIHCKAITFQCDSIDAPDSCSQRFKWNLPQTDNRWPGIITMTRFLLKLFCNHFYYYYYCFYCLLLLFFFINYYYYYYTNNLFHPTTIVTRSYDNKQISSSFSKMRISFVRVVTLRSGSGKVTRRATELKRCMVIERHCYYYYYYKKWVMKLNFSRPWISLDVEQEPSA